tara:strand:- start:398 stop:766 length:369 start_codon:yes stop_codon:yes gene_type:complete
MSNSEQENQEETFTSLYRKATKDVNNLGPLGRIFVAGIVVIVLFKMTPIIDLLWYAFQIVVIPLIFMVAWGVISKETYDLTLGWVDDVITQVRAKREETNTRSSTTEEINTENDEPQESAQN